MKYILALFSFVACAAYAEGADVFEIARGVHHSCMLLESGQVVCYGANGFGQLGLNDMRSRDAREVEHDGLFVNLGAGRTAAHVTVGEAHSCALLDNGAIKCWGDNFFGQAGQGNQNNYGASEAFSVLLERYVDLGRGRTAVQVLANRNHTCALLDNHAVKCWGKSSRDQLGFSSTANIGVFPGQMGDHLRPVDLGAGRRAVSLTVEGLQSCAQLENGGKKCWGLER